MTYDGTTVGFDDRTLAHLQIVIVQKFRAGESFLMSWLDPLNTGDGRSGIWLTPEAPVSFKFEGSRAPSVDRSWLDALTSSAASGTGLIVCNDRGELVRATSHRLSRTVH